MDQVIFDEQESKRIVQTDRVSSVQACGLHIVERSLRPIMHLDTHSDKWCTRCAWWSAVGPGTTRKADEVTWTEHIQTSQLSIWSLQLNIEIEHNTLEIWTSRLYIASEHRNLNIRTWESERLKRAGDHTRQQKFYSEQFYLKINSR